MEVGLLIAANLSGAPNPTRTAPVPKPSRLPWREAIHNFDDVMDNGFG